MFRQQIQMTYAEIIGVIQNDTYIPPWSQKQA